MTTPRKDKLFRDSVHGYVSVPADICEQFIDTPVFQRLRHIEQTSMRSVYPSAHHDRFIHSLGVYHLGKMAFACLRRNAVAGRNGGADLHISDDKWNMYERTFPLACLLHDCGHFPFSHTLEQLYTDKEGVLRQKVLDNELIEAAGSPQFTQDYEYCNASPHEVMGAILVLTLFEPKISASRCDALLAARMILGCDHRSITRKQPLSQEELLENCLIQLLNGVAIDVDKLDYIIRDTWASGVDNVGVDVQRLLGALVLVERSSKFPTLAFSSSALSVLQSAVDARNYLYKWIYSHHKVLYDADLIKRAVVALNEVIQRAKGDDDQSDFLSTVFSAKALREPVSIGGFSFYLPSDSDIAYLLKQFRDKIPEAKEWLFRQNARVPLWKTYAEYDQIIFEHKSNEERNDLNRCLGDRLQEFCRRESLPADTFIGIRASQKTVRIERNRLFIVVRGEILPYTKVFDEKRKDSPVYFLVFGQKEYLTSAICDKCLEFLRQEN